jgi:protoporphyrinogen IX oxidase
MLMLWIKAFHIIFVTSWFAGLFYLPRHKLYRFMTPLALLALAFGLYLWLVYHISGGWLHAKLGLVLGLIGYHLYCGKLMRDFKTGKNTRSHVWYRWFNEVPVIVLFIVVILVVVKPF